MSGLISRLTKSLHTIDEFFARRFSNQASYKVFPDRSQAAGEVAVWNFALSALDKTSLAERNDRVEALGAEAVELSARTLKT